MQNKHLIEAARNILENNNSTQEIYASEQFIEEITRSIVEDKQLNETAAVSVAIAMPALIELAAKTLGSGASMLQIKALAVAYLALLYVSPYVLITLMTQSVGEIMYDVTKPFRGIWNAIKGKYVLKPDELEKAANNVKALLTGNDKGNITRLVNSMKKNIENKDWESAQVVSDQLYKLIKKNNTEK